VNPCRKRNPMELFCHESIIWEYRGMRAIRRAAALRTDCRYTETDRQTCTSRQTDRGSWERLTFGFSEFDLRTHFYAVIHENSNSNSIYTTRSDLSSNVPTTSTQSYITHDNPVDLFTWPSYAEPVRHYFRLQSNQRCTTPNCPQCNFLN